MGHRLVIDYYDDGAVSVVKFNTPHKTSTIQLEVGIDAFYDMEDEWQNPEPELFLHKRVEYYGK